MLWQTRDKSVYSEESQLRCIIIHRLLNYSSSAEQTATLDNHSAIVVLHTLLSSQYLLHLLLQIESIVRLSMVLHHTQSTEPTQPLSQLLPVVVLLQPSKDDNPTPVLPGLGGEDGSDKGYFPCKPGVKEFILLKGLTKHNGFFVNLIQAVEHPNEGTPRHKWIVASLMTAILMLIAFHVLVVDVCVGQKGILVLAGLVQWLQVHLDWLELLLQPTRDDLGVEDVGEQTVYVVGECLEGVRQVTNESLVDEPDVQVREMPHNRLSALYNFGNNSF